MKLHFLGAATTVTGSQFLLETDRAKVLVDCGMFQGSPHDVIRNRVPFGFEPRELHAVLLTHAHLDHCGLIPHLVDEGFRGPVYATRGTAELAGLVLLDSAKLQEEFADRRDRLETRNPDRAKASDERDRRLFQEVTAGLNPEEALRAQPPRVTTTLDTPLYDVPQAERALKQFRSVEYGRSQEVAPGVTAIYHDAGHILGSATIRVEAEGRSIVFSGDVGRTNTPIIRDPTRLDDADYVVVESTYGGREHESQDDAIRALAETIRQVAASKGTLLIPAFTIGRTQEVIWQLDRLIERNEIPLLPLYLDSPMGMKATEIYRHFLDYYDDETKAMVNASRTPLEYPDERYLKNGADSRAVATAPRPYIVVASSGMLTGGRVLGHLKEMVGRPNATLLFVGYQGQGTLGAQILAGVREIHIDGQPFEVKCAVRAIDGFSAHADEPELLAWLGGFARSKRTRNVFLVHGDPDAQLALEPKVRALGLPTFIPKWRQAVTLE